MVLKVLRVLEVLEARVVRRSGRRAGWAGRAGVAGGDFRGRSCCSRLFNAYVAVEALGSCTAITDAGAR